MVRQVAEACDSRQCSHLLHLQELSQCILLVKMDQLAVAVG